MRYLLTCAIVFAALVPDALGQVSRLPTAPNGGPGAAATQQIDARRNYLKAIRVWDFTPIGGLNTDEAAKALAQLDAALRSTDPYVYTSAVQDLTNSQYRSFAEGAVLNLLLPCFKTAETEQMRFTAQGLLIDHVARRYGSKASAALPDILRIVTDVRAQPYLRGQAVEAAARIAPGDKAVVDAFIAAATRPQPANSSGVHDRIAERLGEMGKAAWPAKKALLAIFARGPWYEDSAALALGKLALDDPPRPFADYLDRLAAPDRIPLEQAAAAFLHVQQACLPGSAIRPPNLMALQPFQVHVEQALKGLDRRRAAQSRPVLLKTIADRPGCDVYIRSALRTLVVIGPGASPRAARLLVDVLTRRPIGETPEARNEARAVLALFEPADKAAVPIFADGIDTLAKDDIHEWLSRCTLAQVIGRYGKDARPAAPALLRNLERFRRAPTVAAYPAYEEMAACADALAGAGDVPGARATVLHLLDPDGPLLKKAAGADPTVQASLLLALGKLDLPGAGEERDAVLDRLHGALGSRSGLVVSTGAKLVVRHARSFDAKEVKTLVPRLVRVVTGAAPLKADQASGIVPLDFGANEPTGIPRAFAARALAALGPRARDALPALEALAAQKLVDVRGTFLPEPPLNAIIREARKAVEAIR
jgi:hypothetical protein